jgi:hypothetical protein
MDIVSETFWLHCLKTMKDFRRFTEAQLYSHLLGRIPGFFSSSEPGILKVIGVSVDAHDQHCQPDSLQRDVILLSGENSAKREFTSINTIS